MTGFVGKSRAETCLPLPPQKCDTQFSDLHPDVTSSRKPFLSVLNRLCHLLTWHTFWSFLAFVSLAFEFGDLVERYCVGFQCCFLHKLMDMGALQRVQWICKADRACGGVRAAGSVLRGLPGHSKAAPSYSRCILAEVVRGGDRSDVWVGT